MPRTPAILLALLVVVPTVLALDPLGGQDDAGTGVDGPDAPRDAVVITAGDHEGALTATGADGADWFLVTPEPGQRMMLRYRATSGAIFFQARDASGATLLHQGFSQGAYAVYGGSTATSYRIGFLVDDPSAGATYSFSLHLDAAPQLDAGVPGDAGAVRTTARPVAAGTFAGRLVPADADVRDWYSLEGLPTNVYVRVSIASEGPAKLEAWSPLGRAVHWIDAPANTQFFVVRGLPSHLQVLTDAGSDPFGYTLTIELLPAAPLPQDDGGTGSDAPEVLDGAPLIELGRWYDGVLEHHDGDELDIYRVEIPAGHAGRITLQAIDWYTRYGFDGPTGWAATGGTTSELLGGGPGMRSVHIWDQDISTPTQARYRFRVDPIVPPDVELVALAVDAPSADPVRDVTVRLVNHGSVPIQTSTQVRIVGLFGGGGSLGAAVPATLAPFEERDIVFRWDTRSWIGDFNIEATVHANPDWDTSDQFARLRGVPGSVSFGVGGASGVGVRVPV